MISQLICSDYEKETVKNGVNKVLAVAMVTDDKGLLPTRECKHISR